MDMKNTILSVFTGMAFLISATALAESSNRSEVRSGLSSGGWQVVWGHNFTEGDWLEGTAAIAACVACECAAPFLKWFDYKVDQMVAKLQANFPGVAEASFKQWIAQSINQKTIVRYKNLRIQAGFATYNRWQEVCYNEPRTRRCGWHNLSVCVYTEKVCRPSITLPNWHQFYIRYKLG